jgi:hypothetical protein
MRAAAVFCVNSFVLWASPHSRGCAADQRSDIKDQCFCENRFPVSLTKRKIAGNSRLKGASWSKFDEFTDEFAAIRAAQVRRKIAPRI